MRLVGWLIGCTALVAAMPGANAEDDFWLGGNYTQNVPCKGDGTDRPEVKVHISTQEIESKIGVCTFLDTKVDSNKTYTATLYRCPK
jgi:hypothetical protein